MALDEFGKVIGDITKEATRPGEAKKRKIDESKFEFEGESAEAQRAKAEAARRKGAPSIDAADVERAQIQQAGPAGRTTVGGVDPITGLQIRDVGALGDSEFRARQEALITRLEAQAAGEGTSVAEEQLRRGQEQNIRNQAAIAAAAPGGVNPALAQRNLQQNVATGAREVGAEAAQLRAQEQATAREQLGQVVAGARQQDIQVESANLDARIQTALAQGDQDLAVSLQNQKVAADLVQQQAGLDQQTAMANLASATEQAIAQGNIDLAVNLKQAGLDQEASTINLESELEQQRITNDLVVFYESLGFETDMAQFQASQDLERLKVDQQIAIQTANAQLFGQGLGAGAQVLGGIAGGVGAAIGSDVRGKTDIGSVTDSEIGEALAAALASDEPVEEFLDVLDPYKFRYKDPDAPGAIPGELIGVMAQDAEKSAAGRKMVFETPGGKMLDMGKGFSLLLASSANLNERIKALEE